MGSAVKILPHYTYQDYCQWEGKWELIDGIPHAMSPAPSHAHQNVAGNIFAELRDSLHNIHCKKCKVYQPIDYKVDDFTILQPDILVVCKPITGPVLDFAPDLVVEILSPSTALKDRHTKFEIYQEQGIPYYLIVDIPVRQVEIYRLQDKQYRLEAAAQDMPYSFLLGDDCKPALTPASIWE